MPRHLVSRLTMSVALVITVAACGSDDPPSEEPMTPGPTVAAEETADDTSKDESDDDRDDWVTITDQPTGAQFDFPGTVEPRSYTDQAEDGAELPLRTYTLPAEDDDVEVGFNVLDLDGDDYDLGAGVDAVADTLGGDVVSSDDIDVEGNAGVEVEISHGDDMVALVQLITTDEFVLQPLVSGPKSKREALATTYERLTDSVNVS